jgi:asparagine synthase (glutamine-hydrolysing)
MELHLKINTASLRQFNEEILSIDKMDYSCWPENQLIVTGFGSHSQVIIFRSNYKVLWLIGDPIVEKSKTVLIEKYLEASDFSNLLQSVNGHYRLILFDKQNSTINVTSSLFGILPVYYHRIGSLIYISSNAKSISDETNQNRINKRFILENVLFYYPLFNQTAYHNIVLLPAHHLLEISDKRIWLTKHTYISDWFVRRPKPWKRSTGEMKDLFVDRVKHYLPDEPYIHALTGGFDGRCLVACGLYHQKKFETYGFGNELSTDTVIASELAGIAGVKFNFIKLDNEYVVDHSLDNGLQFIVNSGGNAGFARSHYLFACKSLSRQYRYMVTGNFGSEIFRAAHNAGPLISSNLYHLYNAANAKEALGKIETSPEFEWVNSQAMKQSWDELKSDISGLPVFSNEYSGMTRNEKFYMMIFEEVFRKYFGAEMVNQFHYLSNRTPFLDVPFLKEILKTGLAGVHSDFFENNPVKRFKGQVLYAHIIKKAFPAFNTVLSDKGYRPKDLLSFFGKIFITKSYLKKKLASQLNEIDPNSVDKAFAHNKAYFQKQDIDLAIFNAKKFKTSFASNLDSHDFLIALSQSWFHNRLQETSRLKSNLSFNSIAGQQVTGNGKYS